MMLTLEQLMALPKAAEVTEVIEVPDWGGPVTIRAISLAQRDEMRRDTNANGVHDAGRWDTLVLVNGFADPVLDYDSAAQLRQLKLGGIGQVIDRIWELSGLTPAGQISKAAVDAAEATFRPG